MQGHSWNKILNRSLTILIFGPLIIGAFIMGALPFFIMIQTLAMLSLQEMYTMFQLKKNAFQDHFYFGFALTSTLLAAAFIKDHSAYWNHPLFFTITAAAILFFIYELFAKKVSLSENHIAYLLRSIIYIGVMYSFIILLRQKDNGLYYCLYLVSVVWTNDIFAYLIGKPLGKHKLSPALSPKKSVEGSLAAILGAGLMSANLHYLIDFTIPQAVFLGVAISIFAQLGDFIESLLKRTYKVKNSGSLLPGHGGMLDRMDSFILTFPLFYYFLLFLGK